MARPLIRPDEDLTNADWPKGTWDLPVHNLQELRAWIAVQGLTVAQFKALPVYQRNRDAVKYLKFL